MPGGHSRSERRVTPQTHVAGAAASDQRYSFARENQRVAGNHCRLPECGEAGHAHQGTTEATGQQVSRSLGSQLIPSLPLCFF